MPEMLEQLRKQIDEIDVQLLKLLAERLKICKELGRLKKKNNLPVQNYERELQVIRERTRKFKELGFDEKDDGQFVQELFELIMKKSKEVQK